jgi:anti-sigma factor RsiW
VSHLGDQLSAVVDGELSGAELDRANAHLAHCCTCRDEAHALRRLKKQLRALAADVADSDDFTSRLLAITAAARVEKSATDQAQAPADPYQEARVGEVLVRLLPASRSGRRRRRAGPHPAHPGDYATAPRRPQGTVPDPRRRRQVLWGTLSLVVVGIGSAAFSLGGAGPSGPRIAPQFEVYDQQHAATSGDMPWPESAEAAAGRVALTGRVRAA